MRYMALVCMAICSFFMCEFVHVERRYGHVDVVIWAKGISWGWYGQVPKILTRDLVIMWALMFISYSV